MKKRFSYFLVSVLMLALFAGFTFAQNTKMKNMEDKMSDKFKLPPLNIEEYKLDNGLRVVLNRDDAAPVVAVAVYYDVGSRNEREGRTGFAHLFEHMMFQGSENVKKAEHFQYVFNAGGTMNGTTNSERTNYFEALPANQLPLGLWLESDRMRSLAVTKENLDNQRNAVQEEKRLSENQPFGKVFDELTPMIFKNFANAHSVIGSMDDLDAATVEDVKEFFRIYYAPNNAVLVISGAFEPKEAKELVKKYFGTIPRQPEPPKVDVSEPKEIVQKYKQYEDKLAPFPAFVLGWKVPPGNTTEFDALDLAGQLLNDGESSRLYQKLVKGDESILQLFGGAQERRGPSSFIIGVIPKPGKDLSKIRNVIMSEIKDMAETGPTAAEMQKLHNQLLNSQVRSRQSSLARAQAIAQFTLFEGDPKLVNTELDRLMKITPEQIKDAVNKYLNTDNRVLLDIVPAGKSNGANMEKTEGK